METNTFNSIINLVDPERFMPHGQCLLWEPGLLGLHVVSDLLTVLAYYTIPLALVQLVRKREDLKFGWIFMLFGLFIFLCGTSHLISILTIWQPYYWLEGWIKLAMAIVSVLTAILLWPLIPKAIALPSARQLEAVNNELRNEIQEKTRAQEALKEAQESLEKIVEERTAELRNTNESLRNEIRDRQSAEAQLRISQKRLETIFDHAIDAIIVTDQNGKFLEWNKQAEKIFGWPEYEVLGRDLVSTMIPERYREAHQAGFQRFLSTGESKILDTRVELEALNREQKEFPVELSIAYAEEEEKTFVAFLRDITARKNVEKQLIEAKEEAEHSNRAKSEFLARMSHELRTPMNAILGFGQLLQMDTDHPLPHNQRESVKRILKAGKHLLNLINEVLDLSRVESGKMDLSMENIQIRPLLLEVQSMVMVLAQDMEVSVEVKSSEDLFLYADYIRTKQVLLNLVSNAIKYNNVGGSVRINFEKSGDGKILITVTDTGKGIPRDKQDQVFQPFTRVSANTDQIEGTGIGLTITKRLVENMNGTISFESEFEKGTVFSVEFQEGKEQASQEEAGPIEHKTPPPGESGKKVKMLYIEDNPANLDLVEKILKKRTDIELISTPDAETGIQIARGEQPALIIMDIHLPGMDGLTAFQHLKNYPETVSIPVIALSADAMQTDKNRALAMGFNQYLTKPIDIPEFLATLEGFLV